VNGGKMNTFEYVKMKQQLWAKSKNIELIGSQINHGEPLYTKELIFNLFQDLSESTKKEFEDGDGNELGNGDLPGKMQALHSSSVIGVNFFEYWKQNQRFEILAKSLRIPSKGIDYIKFEEKYKILKDVTMCPNIDVNIHYKDSYLVGIECKYTEPFLSRNTDTGLKKKYLDDFEHWGEFPNLYKLALKICPEDNTNSYLHTAQLIKHILGMYSLKKDKNKFRLLYIFYPALFGNNEKYLDEINTLKEVLEKDDIKFQHLTWQELILNFTKKTQKEDEGYLNYLISRYL